MSYLVRFGRFWYDFVVGDDWTIAAAVTGALVVLAGLSRIDLALFWLLPAVVISFLGVSLWRVTRQS